MCTVLMGNSSQVLIKKRKKKISWVTLSPLIYIFIHHKLGKLISDYIYCILKTGNNPKNIKSHMFVNI